MCVSGCCNATVFGMVLRNTGKENRPFSGVPLRTHPLSFGVPHSSGLRAHSSRCPGPPVNLRWTYEGSVDLPCGARVAELKACAQRLLSRRFLRLIFGGPGRRGPRGGGCGPCREGGEGGGVRWAGLPSVALGKRSSRFKTYIWVCLVFEDVVFVFNRTLKDCFWGAIDIHFILRPRRF